MHCRHISLDFATELRSASVRQRAQPSYAPATANNAFELFGAQLPDFTTIESDFASAEAWSETNVGVPYDQLVNQLNTDFDPFTLFSQLEGPLGQDIQTLFDDTGIQQG